MKGRGGEEGRTREGRREREEGVIGEKDEWKGRRERTDKRRERERMEE